MNSYNELIQKLDAFIRKYYKNQLIRGLIYAVTAFLGFFLIVTTLEYFGHFDTTIRKVLFYSFIALNVFFLIRFVIIPFSKLYKFGKVISHEQAAQIIGKHFSNVSDKLYNTLELQKLSSENKLNTELINASINQKITELRPIPFTSAIDLNKNKKYLRYAAIPALAFVVLLFAAPSLIKDGSERLIKNNTYFEKPAPFRFIVLNKNLKAAQLEDYTINVQLEGEEIPENAYIEIDNNQFKLEKENTVTFNYTFKNVQKTTTFKLTADGYSSKEYELEAIPNPLVLSFDLSLDYPAYLNKTDEVLKNTGDLIIPAGTKVTWHFNARNVETLDIAFGDTLLPMQRFGEDDFKFTRTFKSNTGYAVRPANKYMNSKDSMAYTISVIPDAYPTILVEEQRDSFSTKQVYFKGNLNDDYGFSRLAFAYRYLKSGSDSVQHNTAVAYINIPVHKGLSQDQFYYYLNLDDIKINMGDEVEYYFEVWDNDAVNGAKSARSMSQIIKAPTLEEISKQKEEANKELKDEMKENIDAAKKLQKETNEALKKLTEKKTLDYDDKKKLEDLLKQQKELQSKMENLKTQNEQNNKKQSEFNKTENERILEKQQQLQELFDKTMSEELKEKIRQMEKMMQEMDKDKMKQMLEQMKFDSKDLEKELDRNLEVFKQLETEQKMDDAAKKLEELAKEQEKLAEKAEDKNANAEDLKKQQEELNKKFEDVKKDLKDAEEKNKELENPMDLPKTDEEQKDVDQNQKEAKDQLAKENKKGAGKSQKNAAKKMEEMADKIQKGMQEAEEEKAEEDMNALRALLENLIHFSFDQEKLMTDLKGIDVNNPKYLQLSQQQQKLKDDAKVLEDSLFALSKRVPQISSMVNQEISSINRNADLAIAHLQERQVPMARSDEQYIMTSVNNLALMLSEALQQMQQQMQSQKPASSACKKPGQGKPGKGKPGQGKPSASSMRKMQEELNKQMQKMKEGMKPGEGKKPGQGQPGQGGMSEQFAKMAAQQEALRQMMQDMQNENKGKDGSTGTMGESIKKMEDTEKDLVNKRITEETMKRQQDILTRLLESERAEREREQEEKRESNTATEQIYRNPAQFDEFKKQQSREKEMLQIVPPTMNSFYKNLVNSYFQNTGN